MLTNRPSNPTPEPRKDLGKLVAVHSTSPLFLQRATIVALASFVFFLVMLAAFYVRPQIGYFVLATAFLVVDLFTLIGIWMQKRNVVKLFEKGIAYKKFRAAWNEIESVKVDKAGLQIAKSGESTLIPASIDRFDSIVGAVKAGLESPANQN